MFERIKNFRPNVGMKVAGIVLLFELLMFLAYAILTNIFVDAESFLRYVGDKPLNLIVVVLVSTLVLAGYLAFLFTARIFSPVEDLIRGTEEIIGGNLDVKIQVKTGDELEVLGRRFSVMAASIRAGRQLLESKVLERTRALEEAQKKELERQGEVLKLKDEFLFVAAHELRTPVTSVRWSLESVADQSMDPDVKLAFQDALRASQNLATLVEDLLNMARLDSKRIPFKREFVNVVENVQTVLKQMQSVALKKKVMMRFVETDGSLFMALADARRVNEVLVNLISNAIKYNREGGRVDVSISRGEEDISVAVTDDGMGIPIEEQKHLFEKFWRAKSSSGLEGTGLGLFITKRLVEGMNGRITFESAPGRKTTFTVRLPIARS